MKEVPHVLRGSFVPYQTGLGESRDTLIIESWGYHFKDELNHNWLGQGTISDSLILKNYKDYYFINFKEGNQWVLRIIRLKSPGVLEYFSIDLSDETIRNQKLNQLKKKFRLTELKQSESTFYQIDPNPAQLMSLIKEGYFTSIELRKIK